MPRASALKQSADTTDSTDEPSLPTSDGTHLSMAQWLRDLDSAAHLFDSDISYLLVTASAITSNCKTAVISAEHSRLLLLGQVHAQNYGVLNPPPITNMFRAAYAQARADLYLGKLSGVAYTDLPDPAPPTLPDSHILSADKIKQVDMKLRDKLLSLITAKGRQGHYRKLTLSGCALLEQFAQDAKAASSAYIQSPHIRKLKAQLQQVRRVQLTQISMAEFDYIRDSIQEINDQLIDANDRMSDTQLCDHYLELIYRLNSQGLRLALETHMTIHKVVYGGVQETYNAISHVLTSFLINDEVNAIVTEGSALI